MCNHVALDGVGRNKWCTLEMEMQTLTDRHNMVWVREIRQMTTAYYTYSGGEPMLRDPAVANSIAP